MSKPSTPSTIALRRAYTVWAPIYDVFLSSERIRNARQRSLNLLDDWTNKQVLISGVGSGLDLPFLQCTAAYTGIDITPAMLERARRGASKIAELNIQLLPGNAMQLAFDDAEFDRIIMHLILAVVPEPALALREAARVLKPGGEILILDKFLHPGQNAPLRRVLNLITRNIATRTDVVFEDILVQSAGLTLIHDEPALFNGWFRHIILRKEI
jgi:ubiquinone/menaquinone biosynthesis C-methylase UbiE